MATQADKCASVTVNSSLQRFRKKDAALRAAHTNAGFNFTLRHDIPAALEFNFAPIVFGGTPAGATHRSPCAGRALSFLPAFRDSGTPNFNDAIVVDDQGLEETLCIRFSITGHVRQLQPELTRRRLRARFARRSV